MPAPFDYNIQRPDIMGAIGAYEAGRDRNRQMMQQNKQDMFAQYLPEALKGDQQALQGAQQNATPEQQMQLQNALAQMEDRQLQQTLQQQEKFARLAQWADTPEKWAQATQMAEAEGLKGATQVPFEQRGAKLAGMLSVKDQLDQEWKRREFELNQRNVNSQIGARNAAAQAPAADEFDPADPFAGLSPKARERLILQNAKEYGTVAKENDKEAQGARSTINDANRFTQLSEQVNAPGDWSTGTGGLAGFPGIRQLQSALDSRFSEMEAITARLVPKLREPGSGATSDFDASMFQRGTVGVEKPGQSNKAISVGMKAAAQNLIDKAGFEEAYFKARKTLVGSQEAWQEYLEANPIFDPASQAEPKLNKGRVGWKQHFGVSGQSQQPAGRASSIPLVRTKAQFDALPSGSVYMEEDGNRYTKP